MLTFLLLLTLQAAPQPLTMPLAILDVPRLTAESTIGKAAAARIEALRKDKKKTLSDKQEAVRALVQKNAQQSDVARAQLELQRLGEDADAELKGLNEALQKEFFAKLAPVLDQIAKEDHIGIVLEYPQPSFILWRADSVDITAKVIQRLDAATRDPK